MLGFKRLADRVERAGFENTEVAKVCVQVAGVFADEGVAFSELWRGGD